MKMCLWSLFMCRYSRHYVLDIFHNMEFHNMDIPYYVLDIKMKWTHCKILWSIFTGRMSSAIKKNSGRGGSVHQEVVVPRRGWRRSLIRKILGNDDNRERSQCTTSREGRGRYECQICLWLTGDDTGQLSNPGRWFLIGKMGACDFQWLDNVASINSKSCLRSWNNKSFFSLGKDKGWIRETSTATLPKPLP